MVQKSSSEQFKMCVLAEQLDFGMQSTSASTLYPVESVFVKDQFPSVGVPAAPPQSTRLISVGSSQRIKSLQAGEPELYKHLPNRRACVSGVEAVAQSSLPNLPLH